MIYDELGERVRGKRVIVVGRAKYMLNSAHHDNQGEFIDSHDVVVRVVNPYPVGLTITTGEHDQFIHESYHRLLGTKTHFFHINKFQLPEFIEYRLKLLADTKGVLCVGNDSKYKQVLEQKVEHYSTPEWLSGKIKKEHFDLGGYKTVIRDGVPKQVQVVPTRGIHAIKELLTFDLKSLSLIGFTCYHNLDSGKQARLEEENKKHHSPEIDLYWLYQAVKSDTRIQIDKTLKTVFEVEQDILTRVKSDIETRRLNNDT